MSRRRVMPYDPRDDKPVVERSIFDRKDTPQWEGYGTPKRRPYKPLLDPNQSTDDGVEP